MESTTNRSRIYTVLVLCIGVVTSVWLFQSVPEKISAPSKNNVPVNIIRKMEENVNDDWKKILVKTDAKTQIITNLTSKNDAVFDETTLTAQISKDFLSQYLLLKQGGKTLTDDDINQIIINVSESKNYSEVKGPVYIPLNLKRTSANDAAAEKKYENNVRLVIKTRSSQVKEDPMLLINQAIGPKGASTLAKIDYIIAAAKGFIEDFLKIEVPSQAVSVHLELINSVSRLVADLEAMREINSDPLRSLVGISQYSKDLTSFQNAIKKINLYIDTN
jgi:hypothetical protein